MYRDLKARAIRRERYNICRQKVDAFSYNIRPGDRGNLEKFTPNNVNVLMSAQYEGEYHPICKLDSHPNLNITETKILDGVDLIYDSVDSGDTTYMNLAHLVGIIICQYYSLSKRLEHDRGIIDRGGFVDAPHMRAGEYMIDLIKKHTDILYSNTRSSRTLKDFYECVILDLRREFGRITYYSDYYSRFRDSESRRRRELREARMRAEDDYRRSRGYSPG